MRAGNLIFATVLFFFSIPLSAGPPEGDLTVAAVQLKIDLEMYSSSREFYSRIHSIVRSAAEIQSPDLIIFPEYTGVFTAALNYDLTPLSSSSQEPSLLENPSRVIGLLDPSATSVTEFFLKNDTSSLMDRIFGGLAKEYQVYILGGTAFVPSYTGDDVELRNRAFVYGPGGNRIYSQDKVFLTPFESDLLGIQPGNIKDARPFMVGEQPIALTICRDTFFPVWEERFSDVSLWIDIKANGTEYTPDQEQLFTKALPSRLAASRVPAGITVCLTGEFLGLFWEGPTSLAAASGDDAFTILGSVPATRGRGILVFTLKNNHEISLIRVEN